MPRSIVLPLLGLAAIVLYGTTRAARPDVAEAPRVETAAPRTDLVDMGTTETLQKLAPPPPAPRLRSADAAPGDTAAVDTVYAP